MMVRIFNKVSFNFKHGNAMFLKYSRSIHCVSDASLHVYKNIFSNNRVLVGYCSNKRNFSSIPSVSLYQQAYPKVLYNTDTLLTKRIPINYHPIAVSSIRHISDSTPTFGGEAIITYNGGIFQIISESIFVKYVTELLRLLHYETGLPWWASIIIVTMVTRMAVNLPLFVIDVQTRARIENMTDEMETVALEAKRKVQEKMVSNQLSRARAIMAYRRFVADEQAALYRKYNCHPFKSVATIFLQTPIWLFLSVSVRNMCYMLPYKNSATIQDFNEFSTGGFGWIQNLNEADHLFILPILFGISSLALMEINHVLFSRRDTRFFKIYKNIFRVFIVCIVPLTAQVPSCLPLFWVTNNFCVILQSLLLLSPKFRRITGIPKTDSEPRRPYVKLYRHFVDKVTFKKSVA